MSKRNNKSKKRKKWSNKKKIIISTLVIFTVLIGILVSGYMYVRGKIYSGTEKPSSSEEYAEVPGITNVLLIGTDARTLDEQSRSDSIIIATLDNNNKKIKLTSLFRDTMVNIPGYGEAKINSAYALGGPELLMETISKAYEINLDKYVIINFWGFEAVIDKIDGIEVDVKDYQIEELNKYIGEETGGNDCPVTTPGVQVLNGKQALSYARIRYNVGDEYERTARQREVLFKVAEKLKETKPSKYLGMMNSMLEYIKTNIEPMQALNMAYTIYKFPELITEQLQIPVTELAEGRLYKDLGWVFLVDFEQNKKILHDFIYEDKMPNEEDYDYVAFDNAMAEYAYEELSYNNLYGINPEDYANDENEKLPEKQPEVEEEQEDTTDQVPPVVPETPKPEEPVTINISSLGIYAGMSISNAQTILTSNGINYSVSGTGTILESFTATIKKGETVYLVSKAEEPVIIDIASLGIYSGMTISDAEAILASNGISYSVSGTGTILESFTATIKKGETVYLVAKVEVQN